MAKNKYDFIKELLESKKMTLAQREKVLNLAAKEIGAEGSIETRIKAIEDEIFKNTEPQTNVKIKPEDDLNKYIDPISLYTFLFKYNQNPILKSTCHEIDSSELENINNFCSTSTYDYQEHLKKIKEAFHDHETLYFTSPKLKALIRGYINGTDYKGRLLKKGWSTDSIPVHWSHPLVIEWSQKNPGVPPNLSEILGENIENLGFEFEQIESKLKGKVIQNFRELVIHFKDLFHLRYDNALLDIILYRNEIQEWNEKIEFDINEDSFPRNIEHFTDVDKLVGAYSKLMTIIYENHVESSQKPKVKLKLIETSEKLIFSINHVNSKYKKSKENTISRLGSAYTNLINNQINGLCDFYLYANFGKESARVNLWNGKPREAHNIPDFSGVEHILEFPKKNDL